MLHRLNERAVFAIPAAKALGHRLDKALSARAHRRSPLRLRKCHFRFADQTTTVASLCVQVTALHRVCRLAVSASVPVSSAAAPSFGRKQWRSRPTVREVGPAS